MTHAAFHDLMRTTALDEGITVAELAKRACTSRAEVNDWLDGKRLPSKMEVKRMFGKHHQIVYRVPREAREMPPEPSGDDAQVRAFVQRWETEMPVEAHVEPPQLTESDHEAVEDLFKPAHDPSFGKVLWKLREAANVTQREVAELIGVAHTVVSRWEGDEMLPIQDHYDRLCMIFPELTRYARPPVRDIAKPGFEPGTYDLTPAPAQRTPLTEPPHRVTPVEHEHAPRAPDGLMLLADALDLASLLWPATKPHMGKLVREAGGEWTVTICIEGSGPLFGRGTVPALALGQVRMSLRDEIARRKAIVDEEERMMREAMQKKRDALSELLAYVGEV